MSSPSGAATHTGCLVLFQNGEVDAIAGDDTVLAGLVAQDPYAVVPQMPAAHLRALRHRRQQGPDRPGPLRQPRRWTPSRPTDAGRPATTGGSPTPRPGPRPAAVPLRTRVTPVSLELSPPTPPATGGAPEAPGRLGSSVTPQEAFVYLRDLAMWKDKRKEELGRARLGGPGVERAGRVQPRHARVDGAVEGDQRPLRPARGHLRQRPGRSEGGRADLRPDLGPSRRRTPFRRGQPRALDLRRRWRCPCPRPAACPTR